MTESPPPVRAVTAEVVAVVVALVDGEPCVLEVDAAPRLPAGPLLAGHRSLQAAVRAWAEEQTGRQLGYLEQLYTFADAGADPGSRRLSVSYLGLTAPPPGGVGRGGRWRPWYELFPHEDLRAGTAPLDVVLPRVRAWAAAEPGRRAARAASLFGLDDSRWEADLALQRYELLYEAGLLPESAEGTRDPGGPVPGLPMALDHRRIVATGIARLRAKLTYRPVVFELMPPEFTLGRLQACVEALSGHEVHTQNFRRLVVDQQRLVEETGGLDTATGGRPARLYRFRGEVRQLRSAVGTKLPAPRAR